jgi:hypothetical protein
VVDVILEKLPAETLQNNAAAQKLQNIMKQKLKKRKQQTGNAFNQPFIRQNNE